MYQRGTNSIATIYCIVWNEEIRLPYFIKHYRERFPKCEIVIFDNKSTDKTPKIALDNNCVVVSFDTNNQIDDGAIILIKNNCWKNWDSTRNPWDCWHHWSWTIENEELYLEKYPDVQKLVDACEFNCGMYHWIHKGLYEGRLVPKRPLSSTWSCKTEWCIVVDCDEFLDVDENLLNNADFNIINSEMYDMYGENNNVDAMTYGCLGGRKTSCWKQKEFVNINFDYGAHFCTPQPIGNTVFNKTAIPIYHLKWISFNYVIDRYKNFNTRNEGNIRQGHGIHHRFTESQQLEYYEHLKKDGKLVRYKN